MANIEKVNVTYNLLVNTYLNDPSEAQLEELSGLFKEWVRSKNESLMVSIFDIIDNHESLKVRKLILGLLKRLLPAFKREQVLELWITHPLPSIKPIIYSILKNHSAKIKPETRVASYLMLGEYEKVEELDPDFIHLDSHLQNADPLIESLLVERVNTLKAQKFRKFTNYFTEEKTSIVDLIAKKDFEVLWDTIFDYPFPFICELLKLLEENNFAPNVKRSHDLYELLLELVGTNGWNSIEDILLTAITVLNPIKNTYDALKEEETRDNEFSFNLSPEIFTRPDRIQSRGVANLKGKNLVDKNIGLFVYDEEIRHSDFTGLLSVPLFSQNGIKLAEFQIPAYSKDEFKMDRDGMFFSVNSKGTVYSIDIDILALLLLPISQMTELAFENISVAKELTPPMFIPILDALKLLAGLTLGRSFTLSEINEKEEYLSKDEIECCTIGLDFGNYLTKVVIMPSNCDHKQKERKYPSMIYYKSIGEYYIGNKIIELGAEYSAQTYKGIKEQLLKSRSKSIRVQNSIVNSKIAGRDFLVEVIKDFKKEIGYNPKSISFSYPENANSRYKEWIKKICEDSGFQYVSAFEDTVAILNYSYLFHNTGGLALLVDIGDMHTTVNIAKIPKLRGRSRKIISQKKPITIITKRNKEEGVSIIDRIIEQIILINWQDVELNKPDMTVREIKVKLSVEFEAQVGSANAKIEPINFHASDVPGAGVDLFLQATEYFSHFKQAIDDALSIAVFRKHKKQEISKLIVSGSGGKWPLFSKYLYEKFENKIPILFEDDEFGLAKGLGYLANFQIFHSYIDFDIMVKANHNGSEYFIPVLERGELISGQKKKFRIQKRFRFKQLTIDLWSRKPKLNQYREISPKDNERLSFSKKDKDFFNYDRLVSFPLIFDLKTDGDYLFVLSIDKMGWLSISVHPETYNGEINKIKTVPVL